jgi:hypothetical protein
MEKPFSCPRKQKGSRPLNPMVYPLPPNYHFPKNEGREGASWRWVGGAEDPHYCPWKASTVPTATRHTTSGPFTRNKNVSKIMKATGPRSCSVREKIRTFYDRWQPLLWLREPRCSLFVSLYLSLLLQTREVRSLDLRVRGRGTCCEVRYAALRVRAKSQSSAITMPSPSLASLICIDISVREWISRDLSVLTPHFR